VESDGTVDASKTKTLTDGYVASIEIPLFDFGGARVAEAEQGYLQAANRLAELAVNARSEVREAYHAYRSAFAVARLQRGRTVSQREAQQEASLHFVIPAAEPSGPTHDSETDHIEGTL
jgi:outer membrane protein TolC